MKPFDFKKRSLLHISATVNPISDMDMQLARYLISRDAPIFFESDFIDMFEVALTTGITIRDAFNKVMEGIEYWKVALTTGVSVKTAFDVVIKWIKESK